MAHSEACQQFIEQYIEEGLDQGKTPSSIGKELAALVEKWFETSIPSETLRSKARHMKKKGGGEIATPTPTPSFPTEFPEKRSNQQDTTMQYSSGIPDKRDNQSLRDGQGKFVKAPGPGRPAKYEKEPETTVPTPPIPPEPPKEPMKKQTVAVKESTEIPGKPPIPPVRDVNVVGLQEERPRGAREQVGHL